MRHFAQESTLLPVAGMLIVVMLLLRFMPAHFVLSFVSLYMFIPFAFWTSRIPGWLHYMAARKDVEPRVVYLKHFYSELRLTWLWLQSC
ncbi:MAG: hypothetical protein N2Z22_03150 [Turneriella sp.]|nr:hypothetical protein [Turneriella sp.]